MLSKFRKLMRDERGQLGVEYALVAALIALQFGNFQAFKQDEQKNQTVGNVADELKVYYACLDDYVRAKRGTLLTSLASGPGNVAPAQLSSCLPTGFSNAGSIGQHFIGSVRVVNGGLEYVAFNYGGKTLSDGELGEGAFRLGPLGGAVLNRHPTEIRQTSNWASQPVSNWNGPTYKPGVGSLVMVGKLGPGSITSDHLNRTAVAGVPSANTMATDLDMGTYRLKNAYEILPQGTAVGSGLNSTRMSTLTQLSATFPSGTAANTATGNTLAVRTPTGTIRGATPVVNSDLATKAYVDAASAGTVDYTKYAVGANQVNGANKWCVYPPSNSNGVIIKTLSIGSSAAAYYGSNLTGTKNAMLMSQGTMNMVYLPAGVGLYMASNSGDTCTFDYL